MPERAPTQVQFISRIELTASTELKPLSSRGIDLAYLRRYLHALEDSGFDATLVPYGSSNADSLVLAAAVGQLSRTLTTAVALRPNTVHPLVAAQALATLDQLTGGRTFVHVISGGNDAEQARQGDYLSKDDRYERSAEFIEILRRAWTERAPFSHAGRFYRFDDFGPGFSTSTGAAITVSIGGSSDAAFRVGGTLADVFSFWGEPLAEVDAQIRRVDAIAASVARPRPHVWATFRPIVAATDELAWEKAQRTVAAIEQNHQGSDFYQRSYRRTGAPQNVGAQRTLAFAAQAETYDRALWTKTAAATGGLGASTALVGSPETIAAAILDYVDLGVDLISIRGYDHLNDAIDYGRAVIPLVRQELAHREATGTRGGLQAAHPGALARAETSS